MRYIKYFFFIAIAIMSTHLSLHAQEKAAKPNHINYHLGDTIPHKGFNGRFDRGIVNHLFINKKSWMTGLTISYVGYDSKDTKFLSFIKDFSAQAKAFGINPFIGYFIKPNICVGIKLGYQNIYADLNNLKINVADDIDFKLSDISYSQKILKTTFFHRSYVGIDSGKRFGLFNETSLSFNTGNSAYKRGAVDKRKDTQTSIRELQLGLTPGVTVFIMENVSAELSFNVVGFKYGEEKQTSNGVSTGWRKSSDANFKINFLNINIGIVAYL